VFWERTWLSEGGFAICTLSFEIRKFRQQYSNRGLEEKEVRISRLLSSQTRLTNNAIGNKSGIHLGQGTARSGAVIPPVRGVGWVGPFANPLRDSRSSSKELISKTHKSEAKLKPQIIYFGKNWRGEFWCVFTLQPELA
jgi:hypothetical protein